MRHVTLWTTLLSSALGLTVCAAEIGRVTFDPPDGEFVVRSRHDFKMTFQAAKPLQTGSKLRVIVPIGGWSRPSLDPEREGQSRPGGGLVHVTVTPIGERRFRVTSEPDRAGLWVDNRRMGNTPAEVGPLSPGGHDFRAAKRGRATWTARLRVSRDGKSIKNVTGFQFNKVAHRMVRQSDEKLELSARTAQWTDRGPPYSFRDPVRLVVFTIAGGSLAAGDVLEVSFPNTRVGSWAFHHDPAKNVARYRVQIMPAGAKEWQEIEGGPAYRLVPGPPLGLAVFAPSQVVAGEPFAICVSARDQRGNRAHSFRGDVNVKCSDPKASAPTQLSFERDHRGVMRVKGLTFMTPGEHTIELVGPKSLKQATIRSTPIETLSEAPALRLYWGELHSHGYFSFDARNWGGCTMRPDDMYWYGRNVNGLDFAAVTDHSMHSGGKCGHKNMTEAEFIECQKAAAKNNVDGEFVTFTACEQRCARGDTNVFFLRDDAVYYMKDRAKTIAELWEIYRDEPIFTVPHLHPMVRKPERFDRIDPNKERLVEIHSNHGRYEYHMNEPFRPRKGMVPGNNVQSILSRGHRLGVVAASDDHSGRPGITDVTGVYAPKLTRQAIFDAIRARHTYGSTRFRVNVQFRLGDKIMGDEIRVREADPLFRSRPFHVRVVAADKLKVVQIVRNGKTVYATESKGRVAEFRFEDTEPLDQTYLGTEKNNPPTTYYYVRVLQEPDGNEAAKKRRRGMAWTSPIFLSPAG